MIDFSKDGELTGSKKPVKQDVRKTKTNRDRNLLADYDFADRDLLRESNDRDNGVLGRVVSEEEKVSVEPVDLNRFDNKRFDTRKYQNAERKGSYEPEKF